MGKLKVLPVNVANLIAAGEVVGRPASVVKELMENSVDAGAASVDVIITDAGRTLIQVVDNGCGMSKSDAVLCFERHATSKIAAAEDLDAILTYGFRGEALASIAAVSSVTLKTRRKEDAFGTKVQTDTQNVRTSDCSCPTGANFEIRNLFYNTPARRKFLKSDNVEFKHIVEEFTRVALSKPDINFSLTHNERKVFVLKAAKSLKYRILDLMGSTVVGDIVDFDTTTPLMRVYGFVGRPDTARKTPGNQYFFLNGRYFRSAYLHKAVMNAYEELVPEGMNPPYFIYLEVDPHITDVNIHPTKTEIKFEDEQLIFQSLYACVREVLGKNSFGADIDFDTEGAVTLPQLSRSFEEYKGTINSPDPVLDQSYNPFEGIGRNEAFSSAVDRKQEYGVLFDTGSSVSVSNVLIVGGGKYILVPAASGYMIVNVRRARERVLYEKMLAALSNETHVTQTAMFPVEVELGVSQCLLFKENEKLLKQLGFEIEIKDGSITVNGVPEGYSCEEGKILSLVEDLQRIFADGTQSLGEVMQISLARKFAMLGASGADNLSSAQQAQGLLDELFACENSSLTSDGRKITVLVSTDEIENKF